MFLPFGPSFFQFSYMFFALYTTIGGKKLPVASPQNIKENACFELGMIRSTRLSPRDTITYEDNQHFIKYNNLKPS